MRVDVARVLAPEFLEHAAELRAGWLSLLALAAERESGGIIEGCRAWSRRAWDRAAGLTPAAVERIVQAELARWLESPQDSLEVAFYDGEGEAKARARSESARNAVISRWQKHTDVSTSQVRANNERSTRYGTGEHGTDGTGEGEAQPALPLPGLPAQEPSKAQGKAERDHVIERLWSLQEQLRKQVNPKVRGALLTSDARRAIGKLLDQGFTETDCEHVLHVYAAEAMSKGSLNEAWFNGETNWRPGNFARAQAKEIADAALSPAKRVAVGYAEPDTDFASGVVDLDALMATTKGTRS